MTEEEKLRQSIEYLRNEFGWTNEQLKKMLETWYPQMAGEQLILLLRKEPKAP